MRPKLLAFFAVVIATLSPQTASAATGSADIFLQTVETASAQISGTSGCVTTNVDILAEHYVTQQPPAPPDETNRALIRISQTADCMPAVLNGTGRNLQLDKKSFEVSSQLSSAKLTTSLELGDGHVVIVDLTWADAGNLTSDRQNLHFDFGPRCRVNKQFTSSARAAIVSGTVAHAAHPETNLTPEVGQGVLDSSKEGSRLIGGSFCP
jgi:hypothetical protein